MTLHTCSPPKAALKRWLKDFPSETGSYGHLLLEQQSPCDDQLIAELVPYFESAHGDARAFFHEQMGIDLHPDADAPGAHATYPSCLPPISRRGLFGEVMAGLVTESFAFVGGHEWRIPVFLFRFHEDAEQYLFALAREEGRKRQVYGRRGSDFLGVALNDEGEVVRIIVGEAKWRKALQKAIVHELMYGKDVTNKKTGITKNDGHGIWAQINKDVPVPHGLRQLQRLIRELDPETFSAAILSLDRVLIVRDAEPLPRTNLIFISGNDVPSRGAAVSLIPWQEMPEDYTAGHDLQVVEMILTDGEEVIDGVYDALWPAS
ncbi:MAG TPA: aminotransferase [Allosphingosinicella sp.]